MNLSIIIPNYNGQELLKKNLPLVYEAVKNYKKGRVEIVIADDPSTDNSREVIKDFIEGLKDEHIMGKMVCNDDKDKSGFSKNINRGVTLAEGEIIILLNSDVHPHPDFLKNLIPHFADPKVFAVGCLEESIEGNDKILRGRGIGRWEKGFLFHSKGELNHSNTLWASGGSSAFRWDIWNKIGGLEEVYNPFYWEDIDLSYRALKSGYRIVFERNSRVVHQHEKGTIKTKFENDYVKKIVYRNQFIFVWLNITDNNLLFSHFLYLPYHFITAVLRYDWNFFKGFILALYKIPYILNKRRQYALLLKRSDENVLNDYKI